MTIRGWRGDESAIRPCSAWPSMPRESLSAWKLWVARALAHADVRAEPESESPASLPAIGGGSLERTEGEHADVASRHQSDP